MERPSRYLTPDLFEALSLYAEKHGNNWVERLLDDWRTGRDVNALPDPHGPALRRIRNTKGPTWLNEHYGEGGEA